MLRRADGAGPLLPRPFSVAQVKKGVFSFLIKVMGPGTKTLGQTKPGDEIFCTGPLGAPFPETDPKIGVVILAGGIGIAPFAHLVEQALAKKTKKEEIVLVFGSRNKSMLYDLEFYQKSGIKILLATDDGSAGFRGNSVALLKQEIEAGRISKTKPIIVCGPERMLESAAHLAKEKQLTMYLSLETYMACGVGICNGCAVPVEPKAFDGWPYAKACREGPTFKASCLRI